MRYATQLDAVTMLFITDTFRARMFIDELDSDWVQLSSEEEAVALIAEFTDTSGQSAYTSTAVMERYETFHKMRS